MSFASNGMDELRAKHRKELRDFQSRVTQKKKSATKKTRKSVNDECDREEQDLKARQAAELAELDGGEQNGDHDANADLLSSIVAVTEDDTGLEGKAANISLSDTFDKTAVDQAANNRKPNRQKARLARRAAEQEDLVNEAAKEAASLPDLRKGEREKLLTEFEKRKLVEKVVAANGHCLYSSVADQLLQLGLGLKPKLRSTPGNGESANSEKELEKDDYKDVRQAAADYIASHSDDFVPFLEEPLDEYLHKIRHTGEWGGQLELLALSETYEININVLQADGRIETFKSKSSNEQSEAWLAYYRHGFGLGEHYNSLRRAK